MAVTLNPLTQIGMTVLASWSSTLSPPTYYVYVGGELVSVQTGESYSFSVSPGENVFVEVFDAADHSAASVPSGRLTLCWHQEANAERYRIDQYVGSAWTELATVTADEWFTTYTTGYLADATTHIFRVVPIGEGNAEGDAITFTRLIARYPDPPEAGFAYSDSTTKVTITAS